MLDIKRFAAGLVLGGIGLFGMVFGVGILTNVHSAYLRTLSQWTVLLHNATGKSGATGFIAKGKSGTKYIITNGHVCGLQDEEGKIFAYYRGDEYRLKVVQVYEFNDLCAVEAPSNAGPAVHIARDFSEGEAAYAIGHPLLQPKTVTLGELSGPVKVTVMVGQNVPVEKCQGETYHLIDVSGSFLGLLGVNNFCVRELDAEASTVSILPGNSGSAVVNTFGSVIGVAFAANEAGTRSYVVPLDDLKDFLEDL